MYPKTLLLSLLTCAVLFVVTACRGISTDDISSVDDKTFIAAVSSVKPVSNRADVETELTFSGGQRNQLVSGNGVQINGYRPPVSELLRNRHFLTSATANYNYHLINHDKFQLTIAPGVHLSYYSLKIDSETVQDKINKLNTGFGIKFQTALNFNNQTSLVAKTAIYDSRAHDLFFKTSVFVEHVLKNNASLRFGVAGQVQTDGFSGNGDQCGSEEAAICNDSDIEVGSSGVLFGYHLSR